MRDVLSSLGEDYISTKKAIKDLEKNSKEIVLRNENIAELSESMMELTSRTYRSLYGLLEAKDYVVALFRKNKDDTCFCDGFLFNDFNYSWAAIVNTVLYEEQRVLYHNVVIRDEEDNFEFRERYTPLRPTEDEPHLAFKAHEQKILVPLDDIIMVHQKPKEDYTIREYTVKLPDCAEFTHPQILNRFASYLTGHKSVL